MASFEKVSWRSGWSLDRALPRTTRTAEDARRELEDADEQAGRPLSPAELVDYARERSNLVIHQAFTWSDTEAAGRFRVHQARELRRSLMVTVDIVERSDAEDRRRPVYASVRFEEQKRAYLPTALLVESESGRAALLTEAIDYLKQARRRYALLSELAGVFDEIDRLDAKGEKDGDADHAIA